METGKQMNSLKVLNFKGGLTHFSQVDILQYWFHIKTIWEIYTISSKCM